MNNLKRRENRDASYGISINNVYKIIPYKVPDASGSELEGRILEKVNPFNYSGSGTKAMDNIMRVNKGTLLTLTNPVNNNVIDLYEVTSNILLDISDTNCKDASLISANDYIHGTDYYVYLIWDPDKDEARIVLSRRSDKPQRSESTYYDIYLKVGGFHVGTIRCTTPGEGRALVGGVPIGDDGEEFSAGWEERVIHKTIVHNSVWDLGFRPRVEVVGAAYTRAGLWESIYQISDKSYKLTPRELKRRDNKDSGSTLYLKSSLSDGPEPISAFGALPLTGTEGLNAINASQLAKQVGARLPTYYEYIAGSYGTPQGRDDNDYAWSKTSNTDRYVTGCSVNSVGEYSNTGNVKYAVSADNITQCAGNVWEYLSDITFDIDGGASTVSGDLVTSWKWEDLTSVLEGDFYGGIRGGLAGGHWNNSTHCGGFTFAGDNSVLSVNGYRGCRFAWEHNN